MFEPLSALAVLGFATGTLGFVVSTISKIDEKVQDIRECESRLRSFNWLLDNAYMELRAWYSIWMGRKAFPRETYVHFWGVEGVENIELRIHGINELSDEIKYLLQRPVMGESEKPLSHSEMDDWCYLIHHDARPHAARTTTKRIGLVRKVGFTLFHNTALLEKIGRLKTQVEGLRDYSQSLFRLEQQGDPTKKIVSSELRRIAELKAFVDTISHFGSILYASRLQSPRLEWAIELGPPESGYSLDLWSEVDAMYIDFIVRDTAPNVKTNSGRVRFHVEENSTYEGEDLPLIAEMVEQVVLNSEQPENNSKSHQLFSPLERPISRSRPLRKMLTGSVFSGTRRKSFDVERASLVYGLGHWVVLLWNTPWSDNLCTCGIRCTHLADTNTRHSFLPLPNRSHWSPRSHPPELAKNRMGLLGVALAEIALALPISVVLGEREASFIIEKRPTSRKEILRMLRDKFGRNTITKAVSYCLDPDLADSGSSLRADHLERYCENVVLP